MERSLAQNAAIAAAAGCGAIALFQVALAAERRSATPPTVVDRPSSRHSNGSPAPLPSRSGRAPP